MRIFYNLFPIFSLLRSNYITTFWSLFITWGCVKNKICLFIFPGICYNTNREAIEAALPLDVKLLYANSRQLLGVVGGYFLLPLKTV